MAVQLLTAVHTRPPRLPKASSREASSRAEALSRTPRKYRHEQHARIRGVYSYGPLAYRVYRPLSGANGLNEAPYQQGRAWGVRANLFWGGTVFIVGEEGRR